MTWPLPQPIATAPRDGSQYLASDGKRQWVECAPAGMPPGQWTRYGDPETGPWVGYAMDRGARWWWPLPPIGEAEIRAVEYSEALPW